MEKDLTLLGQYSFIKTSEGCDLFKTSSIPIWQWELRSNGKALKHSKTKVRVTGPVDDWASVTAKAQEVCDQLNAGTYNGPLTVRVSSKKTA